MAGDLLDRILGVIRERKRVARAAYEESQQLERALVALEAGAGEPARRRSKESRPRRARRKSGGRARRGTNRDAILAAARERPGSTAREIADATGIARTTVASTLTRLAANGTVERSEPPGGGVGFRAG
jgi:CRP-like cAMP-binding protein